MKIGIITFIHTQNFGANLQCFALQNTLERLGYDVEVINLYRPIDIGYIPCENDRIKFHSIYTHKSLKDYKSKINGTVANIIKSIFKRKNESQRLNGFVSFRAKYIHFSQKTYKNFTQLYNEFPKNEYSHLIVGSDQVWNYASDFSKEPFFLTFAKGINKISYGASVGHATIPPVVEQIYSNWLTDFSAISVREETSVVAISRLTAKDVCRVLDPTLLLNKKEWLSSFGISQKDGDGYVLVYMLSISDKVIDFARNVAKYMDGLNVKVITNRPYYKSFYDCEFLRAENPISFIDLYCNASFVVTNSFHGTAFAINFNIPFVTIDKKSSRLNSRKQDLLEILSLSDRYIYEEDEQEIGRFIQCDFHEANNILIKEKENSISFLKSALISKD